MRWTIILGALLGCTGDGDKDDIVDPYAPLFDADRVLDIDIQMPSDNPPCFRRCQHGAITTRSYRGNSTRRGGCVAKVAPLRALAKNMWLSSAVLLDSTVEP